MSDTRAPITRMIDAACGFTPEMEAKMVAERALDAARQAAMEQLLLAVEEWYAKPTLEPTVKLRQAWEAVVALAKGTP